MSFSLLFPGQGSQYNGMFKEHFSEFIEFKEAIEIGEDFYKASNSELLDAGYVALTVTSN